MGMTAVAGRRGIQSEINVTPMVDIMLVLLIIFMVVTPFLQAVITVPDRIVYIKSGVGVPYGDVVNVINEVRKLGVDKIGLVADKKTKNSTPAGPITSSAGALLTFSLTPTPVLARNLSPSF